MTSIRRNLIAYFLLLMAVTLSAAGACVNYFVTDALRAREEVESDRVRREADQRRQDERARFDRALTRDARALADEFRKFATGYRQAIPYSPPSVPPLDPWYAAAGRLSIDPWHAAVSRLGGNSAPYRDALFIAHLLTHSDDVLTPTPDHPETEYYQYHLPRGPAPGPLVVVKRSRQPVELPLDIAALEREPRRDDPNYFDEIDVPGQGVYRRVVLRYPIYLLFSRGLPPAPPRGERPEPRGERQETRPDARPERPRGERPPDGPTSIYVQYARRKSDLDDKLEAEDRAKAAALADIHDRQARDLARAFWWLTAIAAAVLVALPTGGWLIVRRGLRPLHTLSHAVSRVSERDFRLPVAADELSQELVPIHARLTQTLDALKRAFEREKQSVADISHELRTPLAALRTTLDVAVRKPRTPEQYQATLNDCREIAKQLSRLTDRILTLASLDAGLSAATRSRVHVGQLAEECLTVIRPLAEAHNLKLTAELDPEVTTTTDPDQLREVIVNLLHNAIEYNRPGGSVHLSVARAGATVRIAIRDTGIGMSDEVRAKIFERFYRADPSRHATGVHAGLGLAIVKEYVDRLAGHLAVTSQPGQGSEFTVDLPIAAV